MTAYGDPEYRAARHLLDAGMLPCWHGCGRTADTVDHVPALADHRHERGTGCCQLRPACQPCNYGAGAAVGNRRRRNRGLAAGTGWSR